MPETGSGVEDGARKTTKARKAPVPPRAPAEPIRATVDALFRNDAIVTEAFRANLQARTRVSELIAKRARTAFESFSASSYPSERRAQRTYLAPGDDLGEALTAVVAEGTDALRQTEEKRALRIVHNAAFDELLNSRDDGTATIELGALVDHMLERFGAGPAPPAELSFPACDVEAEAERLLAEIEGSGAAAPPAPAADETPEASTDGSPTAESLVPDKVDLLLDTLVSPERQVRIDLPKRKDDATVARSIDTFQLRDGPSDVTSYHDFNSLQIAFEHVWTEVFDRQVESLGKQLYEEFVRLKDFAGLDDGTDRSITTVADLERLLTDIRELSRLTKDELPPGLSGHNGASGGDVPAGRNDLGEAVVSVMTGDFIENDALRWLLNPAGAAIGFLGDLLANELQVNWDSFRSDRPLPGGIDVITVTIEPNAVPAGTVEIVLTSSPNAPTWKGIDFYELDATGRPINLLKIANDPRDRGVWKAESYNRLPLYTQQVRAGLLKFGKEIMFGAHKAHYFLIGLDEKLKDRTRVTFHWEKDK